VPEPDEPPLEDAAPEEPPLVSTLDESPLHPAPPPAPTHAHATHTARASGRIAVLLPRKWPHDGPGRTTGSRSMGVSNSFSDMAVFRSLHCWRLRLRTTAAVRGIRAARSNPG
jgi:hypothetical protein